MPWSSSSAGRSSSSAHGAAAGHRFCAGDVLWLVGLPLRALHCCGSDPAVLLAVSREGTDEFAAAPPSETQ